MLPPADFEILRALLDRPAGSLTPDELQRLREFMASREQEFSVHDDRWQSTLALLLQEAEQESLAISRQRRRRQFTLLTACTLLALLAVGGAATLLSTLKDDKGDDARNDVAEVAEPAAMDDPPAEPKTNPATTETTTQSPAAKEIVSPEPPHGTERTNTAIDGDATAPTDPEAPLPRGDVGQAAAANGAEPPLQPPADNNPDNDPEAEIEERARPTLIIDVNKDQYNWYAEVAAAVNDNAFDEAARLIATTPLDQKSRPMRDLWDGQLWLGQQAFVARLLDMHREIAEQLIAKFGELARLRCETAIANHDAAELDRLSVQFLGTAAARDAAMHLGDRSLASGDFGTAASYYRRARYGDVDAPVSAITARQHLVAALGGSPASHLIEQPVELFGETLSANAFNELLTEMRTVNAANRVVPSGMEAPEVPRASLPHEFTARHWAEVDFPVIRLDDELSLASSRDGNARVVAVGISGENLILSSRSQVDAFDLATGNRVWSNPFDGKRTATSLESAVSFRPLVRDEAIVVRHLDTGLPRLACLDPADGKRIWESTPELIVISDPLFHDGRLLAITAKRYDPLAEENDEITAVRRRRRAYLDELQIHLTDFGLRSGMVQNQFPIARLRDQWQLQVPARATFAEGVILATIGGAVFGVEPSGATRWIRESEQQPDSNFAQWPPLGLTAPVARQGKVFLTQPPSSRVECLAIETGARVWSVSTGPSTRILGLAKDALLLETGYGILAVDPSSGVTKWQRDVNELLAAPLFLDSETFVFARRTRNEDGFCYPQFIWIDAETGESIREFSTPAFLHKRRRLPQLALGPYITAGERLFLGYSPTNRASRDQSLYEIVPHSTP